MGIDLLLQEGRHTLASFTEEAAAPLDQSSRRCCRPGSPGAKGGARVDWSPSRASGVAPVALRAARERAGLTQHPLARLIGVAGGECISRRELGSSEPRPEMLVPLAKTLELPVVELLDLVGNVPDLRALRFAAGLSAAEVAAHVHVATVTYQRWEAGRWERLPANEDHLRSLARALRVRTSVVRAALGQARAVVGKPQSPEA